MQRAVLKNHLNWLNSQKGYSNYCESLIFKICPLIRLLHQDLTKQWELEKNNFVNEHTNLERRIIKEIKNIYSMLKICLSHEDLLSEPLIKVRCDSLERILNEKEIYVMPPKYEMAFERLGALVNAIVEIGEKDLVRGYIKSYVECKEYVHKTCTIESYQCNNCCKRFVRPIDSSSQGTSQLLCQICGELLSGLCACEVVTVSRIEAYDKDRFVPSYFALHDLENKFWASPAGAWEQLNTIAWGWKIKNHNYFRKNFGYWNEYARARTRRLVELYSAYDDIQKIKKESSNNIRIRKRERIEQALAVVVAAMYPDLNGEQGSRAYGPEELKLAFDNHVDLVLKVKWADGIDQDYLMHSFQEDGKKRCLFFKSIIQQPGEFIMLNDHGYNARKYLREANIIGVIADLFLMKANKTGAVLKNNKISLQGLSASKLKRVRKFVLNLKLYN